MITARQKLTIKHIGELQNIKEPKDVIKYCIDKMGLPRRNYAGKKTALRRHSRQYYQDILNFYAQGNTLESSKETTE